MHAPLLNQHAQVGARNDARHQAPSVSGHCALGHAAQLVVGHGDGVFEFVGKGAEARTEHEREAHVFEDQVAARAQAGRELRDFGAGLAFVCGAALSSALNHRKAPATVAVIHDANAPPSIALTASLARSVLRSGASAEMPPI